MRNKLILIIILLAAAFLRFNQLGTLPALNADEAAIGYNAYSLIQTGRDEHGNSWPISFESFNDYKPGLFFYIVLPFVKFLGLNEWAVRIPGAALGVLTVLMTYLLVVELKRSHKLGILTAALLAVSPWHIHFSRGGWEVNAATFFITFGVFAFLRWINVKNRKWLIIFVLSFVASFYTYHSARVVVPLLTLGILLFYRSQILKNLRMVFWAALVGIVLLIPLAKEVFGPVGASRAQGVSIFADPGVVDRINEQRGEHGNVASKLGLLIHNKFTNYSLEFMANWGEHFWGQFLFLSGDDIERDKVPDVGELYLFQIPLLLVGLFMIARNPKSWSIILWWLIIASTASALTFQSPHALRSHNMIIPITIISAYGLSGVMGWLGKFNNKHLIVTWYLLLVTVIAWDFSRYLHEYYVHMPKEYSFSSQYGVKDLVNYIKENYDKYPNFAITDKYDQPYILFLFYLQYPSDKFQKEHALTARDRFGFSTVRDFDKFHFEEIGNWDDALKKYKGGLIIGTDKEIPDTANVIGAVNFPNGRPAFQIAAD